jgi:hypothetical protein
VLAQTRKRLSEEHQELIAKLGECPMSCNNIIEAMEDRDGFGVCLEISRSEGAIVEASKLKIKRVIPTYMSLDSFLDSSIFNLKRHTDANGGFDIKNEASLALGLGRESVNAILPLFLFEEHWEFAKRKLPSVFGFVCTLDPMGYDETQFFDIPHLVMTQALQ